jgi:hypothetical protein
MTSRSTIREATEGLAAPIFLYLLAIFLIAPWGDFPLSDDWQYARTAKHFSETGHLVVDTPVAPALVGQVLLAAPWIRLLGFSHTHLRILTLILAGVLLWALWELLRCAGVPASTSRLALCLIALNPFFLFFATTFMTEIYGFLPAFLAALCWFRSRKARPDGPFLSWGACAAAAALAGVSFWTRQYGVLVFPALLGALLVRVVLRGEWRRLRATWQPLGLGLVALVSSIGLYLLWAQAAGNLRHEFTDHIGRTLEFNGRAWVLQTGIFITYMTGLLLPMLLFFARKGEGWIGTTLAGIGVGGLGLWSALYLHKAPSESDAGEFLHQIFPFLGNILYNAGVGTVTLSDVYVLDLPLRPRWPAASWKGIEGILLVANLLWAPALLRFFRHLRTAADTVAAEVLVFALFFAGGSFVAAVQAYRMSVFDRYHFPSFLALTLALAIVLGERPARRIFLLALAPLAFFSVAGLHDEFSWNEARWRLYKDAVESGIPFASLEAGYEIDGWNLFDFYQSEQPVTSCRGSCSCDAGWYCRDNSYTISMNPRDGYRAISSRKPHYWLAKGPPILLLERMSPE